MSTDRPDVAFVVPDIMGGVISIIANLLSYREPDDFSYSVTLTRDARQPYPRSGVRFQADRQSSVEHDLRLDNVWSIFRRLRRTLPEGPGVLVGNDWLELAMLAEMDVGRTVFQIMHVDYEWYYRMAEQHEAVIDAFITYSERVDRELRRRLPHRENTIFHLPYGVLIPESTRRPSPGPLRLFYAGRLQHDQKGVLLLPEIDRRLEELGVERRWSILGDGVDAAALRERWEDDEHVEWLGARSNEEVRRRALEHDVFVLPTRYEGFPVALLEAMAAGLVPVVSDIESGVAQVVEDGVEGFRPPIDDVGAFAEAIATLDRRREKLEEMSRAARDRAAGSYDIRDRVRGYQELFARYRELRRERPRKLSLYRWGLLAQPWIPNPVVRAARSWRKRWSSSESR